MGEYYRSLTNYLLGRVRTENQMARVDKSRGTGAILTLVAPRDNYQYYDSRFLVASVYRLPPTDFNIRLMRLLLIFACTVTILISTRI